MPQAQKSHTLDCASTGMNLPARCSQRGRGFLAKREGEGFRGKERTSNPPLPGPSPDPLGCASLFAELFFLSRHITRNREVRSARDLGTHLGTLPFYS